MNKKKQPTDQASKNTNQQPKNNDNEALLGADNDDADAENNNRRRDYRNNRVKGNPNNRSIDEGSSGRSRSVNSDESGVSNDTAGIATNRKETEKRTIIDRTTSGSGSPAVLSEGEGEERDGTNNVQRAKPNMAGSRVDGLKTGKRQVDQDREIRDATVPQPSGSGSEVSQERKFNQQGQRMREQHSNNSKARKSPGKTKQRASGTYETSNDDGSLKGEEPDGKKDKAKDRKHAKSKKRNKQKD